MGDAYSKLVDLFVGDVHGPHDLELVLECALLGGRLGMLVLDLGVRLILFYRMRNDVASRQKSKKKVSGVCLPE